MIFKGQGKFDGIEVGESECSASSGMRKSAVRLRQKREY